MGHMKDLDRRIRQGGDDAIAAASELAGIAKERRAYDAVNNAASDNISDIVTVLRGVGFASITPSAGESASLLHYCVTYAADEIERLREGSRWISVTETLPPDEVLVLAYRNRCEYGFRRDGKWMDTLYGGVLGNGPTHWMPLPGPPST